MTWYKIEALIQNWGGGGGGGGLKCFAYLDTNVLFVEQLVVTLTLYNGAIQWLMEAGWEGQTAPIWKCMSGIGFHRLIDLLPN